MESQREHLPRMCIAAAETCRVGRLSDISETNIRRKDPQILSSQCDYEWRDGEMLRWGTEVVSTMGARRFAFDRFVLR